MHTHKHTHIHKHTHTNTHTQTQTHTHTHTRSHKPQKWKLRWREHLDYIRQKLTTIQFSTSLVPPYFIKEVVTVVWATVLQDGMSRVRFPIVSLEFFIDIILPAALRPEVDWASNRNYPGGKGGRCVWPITLPPSCVDCLEIWEPQAPGTLRACPGIVYLHLSKKLKIKINMWAEFWFRKFETFSSRLKCGTQMIHSRNCMLFHRPSFFDACNTHRHRNDLICT
jgi:hypothetical protein